MSRQLAEARLDPEDDFHATIGICVRTWDMEEAHMRRFIRLMLLVAVSFALAGNARAQLTSRVYATGLSMPAAFAQDPTDADVQFVVQQNGRIRVVHSGTVLSTDFLDLSAIVQCCGEQGLLGLAFAPDYPVTGRFYVHFSRRPDGNHVVARFRRGTGTPLVADPSSRFDLRWGAPDGPAFIPQPFSNHNGGNLAFGPDGYLYVGLGDGGSAGDPGHRAQNPAT